ncbi:bifunctional DNA primase/polymerase [Pseudoruegeria sp. HB172150]|uniref:bifunctional DNA primase/polymerase n=1 Tax=Pseudoruegeria sp. HB172150 TaxID=2721164 RepID=UPI001556C1CB|nr:bifunctional DNA primase/polymerase [Pseudoruegeria sp. HB172150]
MAVAIEKQPGSDVFQKLRDRKNPYLKPAADAAKDDVRERLPIEYARTAAAAVGNHALQHNMLTLACALAYADAGLYVIDAHALDGSGKPTGPGGQSKVPRGARWEQRASNDLDEILTFWTGDGEYPEDKSGNVYPYAPVSAPRNVAITFPEGCGLFVLDIDGEAGMQALEALEDAHGNLPVTWESITGSGGLHLIFKADGLDIRNTASEIAPGVDIRGKNGQIIAPPSIHPNGSFYRWQDGCAPWECDVADAPEWLRKLAFEATKHRQTDKPKAKQEKKRKTSTKRTSRRQAEGVKGLDAHLADIGDGDGQRGFDAPIYAAACAYFARHSADADSAPLKTALLDAILSSECKDDRAESRYATDDYLDTRIQQARDYIAEQREIEDAEPFDITASLGDTLGEALDSLSRGFRFVNIGGEGKFVRQLARGEPPKLDVWNTTALARWYSNQEYESADGGDINPVAVHSKQATRWGGTAFAPPPATISDSTYNLFRGFAVEPEPGDCTMLEDFIRDIICDGDEEAFRWLWHWMAHLVQRPGEKPKTAVVIWGDGGIGKGHFGRILRALVHPYGTTLGDADSVIGRWAGETHALNLVCVSEEAVFSGDRRVANALKHKVDHEKVRVEVKNIQPFEMDSYTRYVFDSNHPDAISIEGNGSERRYFVQRVSDAKRGDIDYFRRLREQIDGDGIKALFYELATYDPASVGMEWSDVFMAPETSDRAAMEQETMRPVYRAFANMIEDGEFHFEDGMEKYRFVFAKGHTRIPTQWLRAFAERYGDVRQAAERDPARVFERVSGQPLTAVRSRGKCYYRRSGEHDAEEWSEIELNRNCYVLPLNMLPPPSEAAA